MAPNFLRSVHGLKSERTGLHPHEFINCFHACWLSERRQYPIKLYPRIAALYSTHNHHDGQTLRRHRQPGKQRHTVCWLLRDAGNPQRGCWENPLNALLKNPPSFWEVSPKYAYMRWWLYHFIYLLNVQSIKIEDFKGSDQWEGRGFGSSSNH